MQEAANRTQTSAEFDLAELLAENNRLKECLIAAEKRNECLRKEIEKNRTAIVSMRSALFQARNALLLYTSRQYLLVISSKNKIAHLRLLSRLYSGVHGNLILGFVVVTSGILFGEFIVAHL